MVYQRITQIGVGGQAPSEWMLEKALTMEQILPLLTINGPYATFEEDRKGSLTAGKYADLVILTGNPRDATVDGLLNTATPENHSWRYCRVLCCGTGSALPRYTSSYPRSVSSIRNVTGYAIRRLLGRY